MSCWGKSMRGIAVEFPGHREIWSPASLEQRSTDPIPANDDVWIDALHGTPSISLRCLAYGVPLGLLSWAVIIFCIAVGAGY
jgi:hypothetical protein